MKRLPHPLTLAAFALPILTIACGGENSNTETKSVASEYAAFYKDKKTIPSKKTTNPHPFAYTTPEKAFAKMDVFNGKGAYTCQSNSGVNQWSPKIVVSGTFSNGKPSHNLSLTLQHFDKKHVRNYDLQNTTSYDYLSEGFAVRIQSTNGFPEVVVQVPTKMIHKADTLYPSIVSKDAQQFSYWQRNAKTTQFSPIKCTTKQFWDTTRTKTNYSPKERDQAFSNLTPAQRGFEPIPGLSIVGCEASNADYIYKVLAYASNGSVSNRYKDPEVEVISKHNSVTYGPYRLRTGNNGREWNHGAQISGVYFDLQTNSRFGSFGLSHLASDGITRKQPVLTAKGSCGSY